MQVSSDNIKSSGVLSIFAGAKFIGENISAQSRSSGVGLTLTSSTGQEVYTSTSVSFFKSSSVENEESETTLSKDKDYSLLQWRRLLCIWNSLDRHSKSHSLKRLLDEACVVLMKYRNINNTSDELDVTFLEFNARSALLFLDLASLDPDTSKGVLIFASEYVGDDKNDLCSILIHHLLGSSSRHCLLSHRLLKLKNSSNSNKFIINTNGPQTHKQQHRSSFGTRQIFDVLNRLCHGSRNCYKKAMTFAKDIATFVKDVVVRDVDGGGGERQASSISTIASAFTFLKTLHKFTHHPRHLRRSRPVLVKVDDKKIEEQQQQQQHHQDKHHHQDQHHQQAHDRLVDDKDKEGRMMGEDMRTKVEKESVDLYIDHSSSSQQHHGQLHIATVHNDHSEVTITSDTKENDYEEKNLDGEDKKEGVEEDEEEEEYGDDTEFVEDNDGEDGDDELATNDDVTVTEEEEVVAAAAEEHKEESARGTHDLDANEKKVLLMSGPPILDNMSDRKKDDHVQHEALLTLNSSSSSSQVFVNEVSLLWRRAVPNISEMGIKRIVEEVSEYWKAAASTRILIHNDSSDKHDHPDKVSQVETKNDEVILSQEKEEVEEEEVLVSPDLSYLGEIIGDYGQSYHEGDEDENYDEDVVE